MNVKRIVSGNIMIEADYLISSEIPVSTPKKEPVKQQMTVKQKRAKRLTKMFNTSYKTGDYDYQEFGEVQLDNSIKNSQLKNDSYDTNLQLELETRIHNLWIESEWSHTYISSLTSKKEKIPKKMYFPIYEYFYEKLKDDYSIIDITVYVCEYLSFNLKVLYDEILPPLYKSKILEILHKDTNVLNHKRIFRII